MDHENNAPSLLKLIENYDPIFLEIPYDFATLLWGEQLPYVNVLKLVMMIYLMDPKNNSHSLLKLIEEYDPIFLVFILDGPEFLAATMLDRDMLAIAVNWYYVGWFCLVRFVTMRRTNNIGKIYSLEP
ncbi:uncharacterized protein LOC110871304 isoform X1 [Helianthus annuus]|uniref:uncharacterized protein LOC110871304 isoform X1 n=1 Tax=Helianthus annuus TaxID=4232 RepID=UPI000B903027|nr:uncharacterized protein LOC110871304 isoform X1 [Helianthus annuus]